MADLGTSHVANFDGVCEPTNPGGWGGWGYAIVNAAGVEIAADYGALPRGPEMTNNVAEYTAALECVRSWIGLAIAGPLVVRGDSKLVVDQMSRRGQVRDGAYVPLYRELEAMVEASGIAVRWEWVTRDRNIRADELSKRGLAERDRAPTNR